MSDSVRPHRWQPTRLPRPWDSPGKNTGVGCHFLLQCMKMKSESEVAQSCLTLRNPKDCSLPGSSIHGIFQATVLEWGAIAFSAPSAQFSVIFWIWGGSEHRVGESGYKWELWPMVAMNLSAGNLTQSASESSQGRVLRAKFLNVEGPQLL